MAGTSSSGVGLGLGYTSLACTHLSAWCPPYPPSPVYSSRPSVHFLRFCTPLGLGFSLPRVRPVNWGGPPPGVPLRCYCTPVEARLCLLRLGAPLGGCSLSYRRSASGSSGSPILGICFLDLGSPHSLVFSSWAGVLLGALWSFGPGVHSLWDVHLSASCASFRVVRL